MANYRNKDGGYKVKVTVVECREYCCAGCHDQAMIYHLIGLNDARAFISARRVKECKSEMKIPSNLRNHMVRDPRCVCINYNWINQLSNTVIWWLDIRYYIGINYISQMKHQLDATLCRFYFCRVTLHVSGASAHHQEYLKLVRRPLVHVLSLQVSHHISLLGSKLNQFQFRP